MRNRFFYDWVNPKLDIFLLIFMSICVGFTTGLSTSISPYMISEMAINPADVSMASYAYVAGMALSFCIFGRLNNFFTAKNLIIYLSLSMIFFNFILTKTNSPVLVVLVTFFIGVARLTASIIFVVNLIPILMPKGQRYQLYAVYYPISLLTSPIAGYFQVLLSEQFGWHFSFHISNLLLFIVLIICLSLVRNNFVGRRIPMWKFDWFSLFLLSGWMLSFSYLLAYGRTDDWFSSKAIQRAFLASLVLLLLFFLRNTLLKHKILDFEVLKFRNVRIAILLIFVLCLFFSLTTPLTSWMNVTFKNNPVENAKVNAYPVIGYVIGAIICFFYFKFFSGFKKILVFMLVCYIMSSAMMYFLVDLNTSSNQMALPLILRGIAVLSSYITIGLYLSTGLTFYQFTAGSIMLIFVRTFLGPSIFGSFYANWVYYRTIQLTDKLAAWTDVSDPMFQLRFIGSNGPNADALLAYKIIQQQANLGAIKEIFGLTCIFGLIILVLIILVPIYKTVDRRLLNLKNTANSEDIAVTVVA